MKAEVVVASVMFSPEGVEVTFMVLPGDVRNEGLLVSSRMLAVARSHPSYVDEVAELERAAVALVEDVLEDWAGAPVAQAPDEVDEGLGMGQG